jgi:hypothetical protein
MSLDAVPTQWTEHFTGQIRLAPERDNWTDARNRKRDEHRKLRRLRGRYVWLNPWSEGCLVTVIVGAGVRADISEPTGV